jgi:hypothetical protein
LQLIGGIKLLMGGKMADPHLPIFVSVASKEVSISVSALESTLARESASADSKAVVSSQLKVKE